MKGKRVAVVGLGASGLAAAKLCRSRGATVTGVDQKPVAFAEGDFVLQKDARFEGFDLVVVSPGVPTFAALEAAKCPIWGEIELAFQCRMHVSPVVAVGGTNGKSTVTSLVAALLEAAGKKVFAGGNLGEPWAAHADEEFDVVVLEVSSFQMERVSAFRPNVAVLLNVTDDHLDRYASFDDYARAKGNAFVNQTPDDLAVVPAGDAICLREAKRGRARVATFDESLDYELRLRGAHNRANASAALAAIEPFGVPRDVIARVLATFEGLPHRMAHVAEIGGVHYYDDSKGTNVGASVTALLGLAEARAVLIAGGRDKHGSYAPLADAMKKKGRAAVVIGEAAAHIEDALGPIVPVVRAASMDEAVKKSAELAKPGDAVLLSPACSSFDMFRDYKHRGDEFVRAVRALGGRS
ncbi:MAG TPA: UDP-N-acetylmuramoyl-L-alanine--D-glutamate ligase [Polyangiaceae bacterium]